MTILVAKRDERTHGNLPGNMSKKSGWKRQGVGWKKHG